MTILANFDFNGHNLNVVNLNGEFWFVGKEVATILQYANTAQAVQQHCDLEDTITDIELTKKVQEFTQSNFKAITRAVYINEAALYCLVIGSEKPEAKVFKKWVTSDVLPTLRKTGEYRLRPSVMPTVEPVKLPTPEEKLATVNLALSLLKEINGGVPNLSDRDKVMFENIIKNSVRSIDNEASVSQVEPQEERKLTLTEIAKAVFGVNVRVGSRTGCDAHLGGRLVTRWREKYQLPKDAKPEKTSKYFNRTTTASTSSGQEIQAMNCYPKEDWHLVGELLVEYGYAIQKGRELLLTVAER